MEGEPGIKKSTLVDRRRKFRTSEALFGVILTRKTFRRAQLALLQRGAQKEALLTNKAAVSESTRGAARGTLEHEVERPVSRLEVEQPFDCLKGSTVQVVEGAVEFQEKGVAGTLNWKERVSLVKLILYGVVEGNFDEFDVDGKVRRGVSFKEVIRKRKYEVGS